MGCIKLACRPHIPRTEQITGFLGSLAVLKIEKNNLGPLERTFQKNKNNKTSDQIRLHLDLGHMNFFKYKQQQLRNKGLDNEGTWI